MNIMDIIDSRIDPWEVLDIPRDAEDHEIKEAWKARTVSGRKRDRLHLAYKMIATAEDRELYRLLSPGTPETLEGFEQQLPLRSRYSGPGIWYNSLKKILETETGEEQTTE
ncbi:MAG: hypothetical protein PQJ58_00785 [Spirochaetales bacterium]|nr:hypothetical protein [Spirochaetales bacterium]